VAVDFGDFATNATANAPQEEDKQIVVRTRTRYNPDAQFSHTGGRYLMRFPKPDPGPWGHACPWRQLAVELSREELAVFIRDDTGAMVRLGELHASDQEAQIADNMMAVNFREWYGTPGIRSTIFAPRGGLG